LNGTPNLDSNRREKSVGAARKSAAAHNKNFCARHTMAIKRD
jgi:hypothetical protein